MDLHAQLVDSDNFSNSQVVRKSVVTSDGGVVAAQHHLASKAGAIILARGGNAVDAAIATSFALGVVEPWMSGPGGGGAMLIHKASDQSTRVIDFNMRSPADLDPDTYPVVEGTDEDLFAWPSVFEDRNVKGATAIAVPGLVDGMGMAHRNHASMPWSDLLQPSITMAQAGPQVDWYSTLMTVASAPDLASDPVAGSVFLKDGRSRAAPWTALAEERLDFSPMAAMLQKLADEGPREFYDGDTGKNLAADVQAYGGFLSHQDLMNYKARELEPLTYSHGEASLMLTPELTAGSTMRAALSTFPLSEFATSKTGPGANDYLTIARGIQRAQEARLDTMGDVENGRTQTCTTTFSVVDKWGNMVVVTQTLLSIFGSKVMLPNSGMLMNNGIFWFNPEPGHPNSLGPSKRCLTNICPVIGKKDDLMFGVGASGGRKIMSAVLQLTSFMTDFGMSLEDAFHQARIDCSTSGHVIVDDALPPDVAALISKEYSTTTTRRNVYPYSFACPSGVARENGQNYGMTEIMSPWGDAVAENSI